jgi:hypothetical protein
MYVIHLLLPLSDNHGHKFDPQLFREARRELTERFGGVTAFVRSPALGLWKENDQDINRDDVVMFEVVTDEIDRDWWKNYRNKLEAEFRQEEMMIWAVNTTRL